MKMEFAGDVKMNNKIPPETEEAIIYEGDLILTEDFKTEKKLIVKGNILGKDGKRYNINAWDINAWDINAWDINAWDINARNISARNIDAGDIDARNINAWDINAWDINARDIDAWDMHAGDINAWDINAWDINAGDIVCEKRIKKSEKAITRARIFIENKSKLERKEW